MIKVQNELGKKLFIDLEKIQAVVLNGDVFTFLLLGFNYQCMERDMPEELKKFCQEQGILKI